MSQSRKRASAYDGDSQDSNKVSSYSVKGRLGAATKPTQINCVHARSYSLYRYGTIESWCSWFKAPTTCKEEEN